MQNDKQKYKDDFIKRLIKFSVETVKLCEKIRNERNLSSLADQLVRSATSIGANVVEAKGSASTRDYARFFDIALKSANETKYWFMVLIETSQNNRSDLERLFGEVDQLAKIIGASLLTMRGRR